MGKRKYIEGVSKKMQDSILDEGHETAFHKFRGEFDSLAETDGARVEDVCKEITEQLFLQNSEVEEAPEETTTRLFQSASCDNIYGLRIDPFKDIPEQLPPTNPVALSAEPADSKQREYIEGVSREIQDLVLDGESDAAFLKIQKERKCSALVAEEIRKEITEQLSQANATVDLSKAAPSHAPKKLIAVVVGAAIVLAIVTCNSGTTDTQQSSTTHTQRSQPKKEKASTQELKSMLITLAKMKVPNELLCPRTAKFGYSDEFTVTQTTAGDIWVVESYVDAQNSFGAMVRQRFVMEVRLFYDNEGKIAYEVKDVTLSLR
jgi:hypothetical protein